MQKNLRDRLRVAVAEYEQHTASIPPEGDPDSDWWYGKWAETILPVIKDVLKDGSS
jgi:hypothetical protein